MAYRNIARRRAYRGNSVLACMDGRMGGRMGGRMDYRT